MITHVTYFCWLVFVEELSLNEKVDFVNEAKTLMYIGRHPNIIGLIGLSTQCGKLF